jgi:hypothetical protein
MESNRRSNVWVITATVRSENRVAIYCRISTTERLLLRGEILCKYGNM